MLTRQGHWNQHNPFHEIEKWAVIPKRHQSSRFRDSFTDVFMLKVVQVRLKSKTIYFQFEYANFEFWIYFGILYYGRLQNSCNQTPCGRTKVIIYLRDRR